MWNFSLHTTSECVLILVLVLCSTNPLQETNNVADVEVGYNGIIHGVDRANDNDDDFDNKTVEPQYE